ncbi:hypothetical protein [Roseateles depolymerans]|uniref:hypothetical protein n=1 Tax=Roseateles depolymerans TaxID=76731 RepID=UPI0011C03E54|nr:hypothetical protein [Roseateles depolymerans]
MDSLFFWMIVIGVVEGVIQYFWIAPYFKVGIPILMVRVPENLGGSKDGIELLKFFSNNGGDILVRQKKYGAARFAYFHGVLKCPDIGRGLSKKCVLFANWNIPLFGMFFASVLFRDSAVASALGTAFAIVLCVYFANSNRDQILRECVNAVREVGCRS